MEITAQIHESLQEAEKITDCGICGNDWIILWMADCNMTELCYFLNAKFYSITFNFILIELNFLCEFKKNY